MGLIAKGRQVLPPNNPPEWVTTPNPSFVFSADGTYDLNQDVEDQEGDTLIYVLGSASAALPTGVTLSSGGVLTATSAFAASATSAIFVEVNDGINANVTSPSFNILGTNLAVGDSYPRIGMAAMGNWVESGVQSTYGTLAAKCQQIAKADVAIVGGWRSWSYTAEVTKNFSELAGYIKSFNSNIKLFKYTNCVELDNSAGGEDAFRRTKVESETGPNSQTDWYLYKADDTHVSTFGSNWRVNHTAEVVDDAAGLDYAQWSARYYHYDSGETGGDWDYTGYGVKVENSWDGYFEDVMDYSGKTSADWNNNGSNEDKIAQAVIDRVSTGHITYHAEWDSLEPTFLKAGNLTIPVMNWNNLGFAEGGTNFSHMPTGYNQLVNAPYVEWWLGKKIVSFEQWGGWEPCMRQMKNAISIAKAPKYTIVNGFVGGSDAMNTDATAMAQGYTGGVTPVTRTNAEWTRYQLCSCLLDDAYFDLMDGTGLEHEKMYEMDEFEFNLGQPKTAPNYNSSNASGYNSYSNGVYTREFDNGIAIVNPKNNGEQTITLPSAGSGFRWDRLGSADIGRTPEDTTANSGATNITSVTIKDRDGLILKRTAT